MEKTNELGSFEVSRLKQQFMAIVLAFLTFYFARQNLDFSKSKIFLSKLEMDTYDLNRTFEMGVQCLKMSESPYGYPTNLTLELDFKKREQHYKNILSMTAPYREYPVHSFGGYNGPWIEDVWIDTFIGKNYSTFGPFIPLFVAWLNMYKYERGREYRNLIREVFKMLDPNYIYITVVQSCYGIEGFRGLMKEVPPNLIILTPASRGHVPVPHLRAIQPIVDMKPIKYETVFLGTDIYTARRQVIKYMKEKYGDKFIANKSVGDQWRNIHAESKVVLSPRGYARGCWRTFEVLQQGFIPVVIFDDHYWLPYMNSQLPWDDIAITGYTDNIDEINEKIKKITPQRREEMRKTILKYRDTHFTFNGTMNQIELFMNGLGDLRCDRYYYDI